LEAEIAEQEVWLELINLGDSVKPAPMDDGGIRGPLLAEGSRLPVQVGGSITATFHTIIESILKVRENEWQNQSNSEVFEF
jgi:hypothetical protein